MSGARSRLRAWCSIIATSYLCVARALAADIVWTDVGTQVDVFEASPRSASDFAFVQKISRASDAGGAYPERFGAAVSIHGDTLAIGMPHNATRLDFRGEVWMYRRATPGVRNSNWTLLQILKAPDGRAGDYFASALDLFEDTLVVGAPFDSPHDDLSRTGSAYVFVRSVPDDPRSLWTFSAKIQNPAPVALDHFGESVAVAEGVLVIGAPGKDVSEDGSQVPYGISLHNIGAVYVYGVSTRTNDGYVLLNRLEVGSTLSDAKTYDGEGERFGASVAVHGDTLVATVDNDHPVTGNASITGCVLGYVFVRAEPGVKTSRWEYKTFLGVAACASNLRHDKSVAIHGDVAVLGAPEHDHDEVDVNGTVRAHYRAGQAYVYTRDTAGDVHSSWSLSQTVHAESFAPFDHFGRAVGVARGGDAVVIGAPGKNGNESWTNVSNGGTASDGVDDLDRGAVYVFYRTWSRDGSTPTWTLAARFVSPPDSKREAFGSALATHGDGVVVGVDGLDAFPGASYYFALPQSTYDYDDDDDDGTVVVVAPAPEVPQKNDDPSLTDWRFVSSAVAIAIAATPLTFLVICIFLFKPWLRRKLLDRGWKRLADTIVPDWKYDVRLMHVEFSKLKEFIKEQSYPRLTNVRPILKADELKIADARDGGAHVKLGKPAMGAMTVGTLRGETVAVNSMFPGGAGPGGVPKKVAGSLAREVKNLATLNHPNLRLIKGCVPEKGVVVMEHCKGGSVREKMSLDEESGGMNKYETIAIALGAASGLAYLQRENVVHGDLTTDSMHLDEKGGAKLGDFGFSQTKKNIEKTTNARGWFGLGSPVQPTADSNPKDGNVRRNGNRPFVAVSGPVNESHEPADFFEDSAPARFWTGARSSRRAASRDDDERRNAPGPVCEKAEKNEEEEAEKAAWMAPELLKKGKKAKKTMESDVYALGMTLWHLYERRKPYGEASAYEIKVRVLNGERPVFKSTSVPVKIKGIVECCLKAKPKARPAATEISFMIQEAAKEMKKATKLVDKGIVKHEKRFET